MRSHELVETIVDAMAESHSEERVLRQALYSLISLAKSEQIIVDDEILHAVAPADRRDGPAGAPMH